MRIEPDVDKYIVKLFTNLCLFLSFNPPDSEHYQELHKFLLDWIKRKEGA